MSKNTHVIGSGGSLTGTIHLSKIFIMKSTSSTDPLKWEPTMHVHVGSHWSHMDIDEIQTYKISHLEEERERHLKEALAAQNRTKTEQSKNNDTPKRARFFENDVIDSKQKKNINVRNFEQPGNLYECQPGMTITDRTEIFNMLCSVGDYHNLQLLKMLSKRTRSEIVQLCMGGTQDHFQDFFVTRQRLLRRILYAVHRHQHRLRILVSRHEKKLIDHILFRLRNEAREASIDAHVRQLESTTLCAEVSSNAGESEAQIDPNMILLDRNEVSPQLIPMTVLQAMQDVLNLQEALSAEQSGDLKKELGIRLSHQIDIVIDNMMHILTNFGPSAWLSTTTDSSSTSELKFVQEIPDQISNIQNFLCDVCIERKFELSYQSENGDKALMMDPVSPTMRLRAFVCHLHMVVARGSFTGFLNVIELVCLDSVRSQHSEGNIFENEINANYISKVIDDAFKELNNGCGSNEVSREAIPNQDGPGNTEILPNPCGSSQYSDAADTQSVNMSTHTHEFHPDHDIGNHCPENPNKSRLEELKSVFALLDTLILGLVDSRPKKHLIENSQQSAHKNLWKCPLLATYGDEKAEVWSCGQNSYGELGHGDTVARNSFTRVESLLQRSVKEIAAGNEHSVVLTEEGEVLTCGYNDNGQCGHNSTKRASYFKKVSELSSAQISSIYSFNGCEHSLLLSNDGRVATCGFNDYGQLGQGNTNGLLVPNFINSFGKRQVRNISCSYYHTIFACSDFGTLLPTLLFTCGRNDFGQLGTGDIENRNIPTLVVKFPASAIVQSLGCGQYHSIVIFTTRAKGDQGQICAFGKNDCGQLGCGKSGFQILPVILPSFRSNTTAQHNPKFIKCGYYHNIVLCEEGHVWGFGRNDYGQLGFETNLNDGIPHSSRPQLIKSLEGKDVSTIACGSYHTIAACENGLLYVFGRNNHGQLGTADNNDLATPFPVIAFINRHISRLSAGFYHTIILIGGAEIKEIGYSDGNEEMNEGVRVQDSFHDVILSHSSVTQMLKIQPSDCPEIVSIHTENNPEDNHNQKGDDFFVKSKWVTEDSHLNAKISPGQNTYSLVLLITLLAQMSRLSEPYTPKDLNRYETRHDDISPTEITAATSEQLDFLYGKCETSKSTSFSIETWRLYGIDSSPRNLRALLDLLQSFERSDCRVPMQYAFLDRIVQNDTSDPILSNFSTQVYMREVVLSLIQASLKRFLDSGYAHVTLLTQMINEDNNSMGRIEMLHEMLIVIFVLRDHLLKYIDENPPSVRLKNLYITTVLQNWNIFFPCPCLQAHFIMHLLPDQEPPISPSIIDSYVSCLQIHQDKSNGAILFGFPSLEAQTKAMLLVPVLSIVSKDSHMVNSLPILQNHLGRYQSEIHEGTWQSTQLLYTLIFEQLMGDNIDALDDESRMEMVDAGTSPSVYYFRYLLCLLKHISSWVTHQPHRTIPIPAVDEATTPNSTRINHILEVILYHESALKASGDYLSNLRPSSWRYFLKFVLDTLLHCDELLRQANDKFAASCMSLEKLMMFLKEQTAVGRVLPSVVSCLMVLVSNSLVASTLYSSLFRLLKSLGDLNKNIELKTKTDWLHEITSTEIDKKPTNNSKRVFKVPWAQLLQKELVAITVDLAVQNSKGDCPFDVEWMETQPESVPKYVDAASCQASLNEWSNSDLFESGLDPASRLNNSVQRAKIVKRIGPKKTFQMLQSLSDYALVTHEEIWQFSRNLSGQESTKMMNDAFMFSEWVRNQYSKCDGAYGILLRQRKKEGIIDEYTAHHFEKTVAIENALFAAILMHIPNLASMACFISNRRACNQYKAGSSPLPKSLQAIWRQIAMIVKEFASKKRILQQQDKGLELLYCSQHSIIERSQILLSMAIPGYLEETDTIVILKNIVAPKGLHGKSCNISYFWKCLKSRFHVCLRWRSVTQPVDAKILQVIKFVTDPRIPSDRTGFEMFCTALMAEPFRRNQSCAIGLLNLHEVMSWVSVGMSPLLQKDVFERIGRVVLLNPSFPHVIEYAHTQHEDGNPQVSAFPRRTSFRLSSKLTASSESSIYQHLHLFGAVTISSAGSISHQYVSMARHETWQHFFPRLSDLIYVISQPNRNAELIKERALIHRLFANTLSCCSLEIATDSYNSHWDILKLLQFVLKHSCSDQSIVSIDMDRILEFIRIYFHSLLVQVGMAPANGTTSKKLMISTANDIIYNETIRLQTVADAEVTKFRDSMAPSSSIRNHIIMNPIRLSDIHKGVVSSSRSETSSHPVKVIETGCNDEHNGWSISGWIYLLQAPSIADSDIPFNSFVSSHNIHDDDALMRFVLLRENSMQVFPYVLLSGRFDTNLNRICWFLEAGQGSGSKFDQKNPEIQHLDRLCSKRSIPQMKWTQFTVVSEHNKFRLYLNGILEAQCTPETRLPKFSNCGLECNFHIGKAFTNVKVNKEGVENVHFAEQFLSILFSGSSDMENNRIPTMNGYIALLSNHLRALSSIHVRLVCEKEKDQIGQYSITKQLSAKYGMDGVDENVKAQLSQMQCRSNKMVETLSILRSVIRTIPNTDLALTQKQIHRWIDFIWLQLRNGSCWSLVQASVRLFSSFLLPTSTASDFTEHAIKLLAHEKTCPNGTLIEELFYLIGSFTDFRTCIQKFEGCRACTNTDDTRPYCAFCDCVQPHEHKNIAIANELVQLLDYLAASAPQIWGFVIQNSASSILASNDDTFISKNKKYGVHYYFGGIIEISNRCGAIAELLNSGRLSSVVFRSAELHGTDVNKLEEGLTELVIIKIKDCTRYAGCPENNRDTSFDPTKMQRFPKHETLCSGKQIVQLPAEFLALGATRKTSVCEAIGLHSPNLIRLVTNSVRVKLREFMNCNTTRQLIDQSQNITSLMRVMAIMVRRESFAYHISTESSEMHDLMDVLLKPALRVVDSKENLHCQSLSEITQRVWILRCQLYKVIEQLKEDGEEELEKACQSISMHRASTGLRKSSKSGASAITERNYSIGENTEIPFVTFEDNTYNNEESRHHCRSDWSSRRSQSRYASEYVSIEKDQYMDVCDFYHGHSSDDMSESIENQEHDDAEWLENDSDSNPDEVEFSENDEKRTSEAAIDEDDRSQLKRLIEELKMMGFPKSWCIMALQETGEDLVAASGWIVDNLENLIGSQAGIEKDISHESKLECCSYSDEEDDPVQDNAQERPDLCTSSSKTSGSKLGVDFIDKETARKTFAEMYFPLHNGGYHHNVRDQYVQTWKKALRIPYRNRKTSTDTTTDFPVVPKDSRPGVSSMDAIAISTFTCTELQMFQEYVDGIMDLQTLVQLLLDHEVAQTILMSRKIVANIVSSKTIEWMPMLQTVSYSALFDYIKLVFWRGDQFTVIQESDRRARSSRLKIKEVVTTCLSSYMKLDSDEFTSALANFILREMEMACSNDQYNSILWTQRALHRNDSAALSEPGIEIIVFLSEWMLLSNDSRTICPGVFKLCNELGNTLYKSTNLAIRFLFNRTYSHALSYLLRKGGNMPEGLTNQLALVLKAAHARHTREWTQRRFFYSNYLLSYVDLICILCKVLPTSSEVLPTHQPAAKEFDRPIAFQTRVLGPNKFKVSQDATTVAYRGQHVWNTIMAVEFYTVGCHHWSFRIDKLPSSYIFFGVCSDRTDTNSFLGSDNESWGIMGDGGLYHRHNRVQSCSLTLSEGDLIECMLDSELGRLSFSKNGAELGSFDDIIGRVAPAVSFYSRSQKVTLLTPSPLTLPTSFLDVPVLTTHNPTGEIDGTIRSCVWAFEWMEWILADSNANVLHTAPSLSNELIQYAYDMYEEWIREITHCLVTRTGGLLWVNIAQQHEEALKHTKRVTTSRGPGTILGTSYNRIWVQLDDEVGIWFFHPFKMKSTDDAVINWLAGSDRSSDAKFILDNESKLNAAESEETRITMLETSPILSRDEFGEYFWSPSKSSQMNLTLSLHLIKLVNQSSAENRERNPWSITPAQLRSLMSSQDSKSCYFKFKDIPVESLLTHFAILRAYNRLMASVLPFFDLTWFNFNLNNSSLSCKVFSRTRGLLFTHIKDKMMVPLLAKTAIPPTHTEDEFDFPDDIPQITINRPRAAAARLLYSEYLFRSPKASAMEATLIKPRWLFDSLFGQAFEAIHSLSIDQLRTVYNHRMDDGQARTFKVNFDGEGADDYGGPYREFFSHFFLELQSLIEADDEYGRCFLPFFMPCPNWRNGVGSNREKIILNTRAMRSCHHESESFVSDGFPEKYDGRKLEPIDMYKSFSSTICDMGEVFHDSDCTENPETNTPNASNMQIEKKSCSCHVQEKSEVIGEMFYFIGQMFGICLRTKICFHMDLATCIWEGILSVDEETDQSTSSNQRSNSDKGTLKMLQEIDIVSYSSILQLQAICDEIAQGAITDRRRTVLLQNMHAMDLTFVTHLSDGTLVELCTNGKNRGVTLDNLAEYIARCLRARRRENAHIISIIKQGLASVVPYAAVSLYTCDELARRLCGDDSVNIELLKENTEYDEGICDRDECVQRFWRVLSDFTEQDKRMFLQFVWARSRLPAGENRFYQKFKLQKFSSLETEPTNITASGLGDTITTSTGDILPDSNVNLLQQNNVETTVHTNGVLAGSDDVKSASATIDVTSSTESTIIRSKYDDSQLPRSHTCFFALQLPRYSNDEICQKQLLYAIHNCIEMDGDFRPADSESSSWKELDVEPDAPTLF
uniref:HECT E3 ubiquitin ligase putative n=1 Tax=Albugo laibachii Nc14 TaxID=890382 RepID=F0WJF1_9STRA|nr:HECT E3 ubiquitin ligase putative [Albugo laibachii Nc14]|eukprot:CCA21400.1 HECT E3 ubiquitin ligase putative [Albugo laibachii Nc14]